MSIYYVVTFSKNFEFSHMLLQKKKKKRTTPYLYG